MALRIIKVLLNTKVNRARINIKHAKIIIKGGDLTMHSILKKAGDTAPAYSKMK